MVRLRCEFKITNLYHWFLILTRQTEIDSYKTEMYENLEKLNGLRNRIWNLQNGLFLFLLLLLEFNVRWLVRRAVNLTSKMDSRHSQVNLQILLDVVILPF